MKGEREEIVPLLLPQPLLKPGIGLFSRQVFVREIYIPDQVFFDPRFNVNDRVPHGAP
jgi:hypothetical protein